MKRSKVETAETRRRIIKAAGQEFRRDGIQATGVVNVMAAAGLTHGGFYRHFVSKEQLLAEACAAGMEDVVKSAQQAAIRPDGTGGLEAILSSYLALEHRDDAVEGCPLAGLGSELARSDLETREAAASGFLDLVQLVAKEIPRRSSQDAKADAIFAISAMVGAITMSRILPDPELSAAVLESAKKHLSRLKSR